MMKRIVCMLCMLMICCGMIPMECDAAVINPDQPCSLTLSYTRNGNGFSNLNIDIYRVAGLSDNGNYELLEPFSTYPITIHGITSQKQWKDTAQTIKHYVIANQVKAYQSQKTDQEGRAYFAGLEAGLYMVKGTTARNSDGVVTFHDFMIYLPAPVEDGYDYNVKAIPKYSKDTSPEGYSKKYKVIKLWQDTNASGHRPEAVSVDILKDGVVQKSVTLSSVNNWSYSWEVSDKDGVWSVMEKNVPDGYQVSITNNKTTFTIINSKSPASPDKPVTPDEPDETFDEPEVPKGEPDVPEEPIIIPGQLVEDIPDPKSPLGDAPKTGDTSPLLLYVIIMCISGIALIILSVLRLKEGKHEKKQ